MKPHHLAALLLALVTSMTATLTFGQQPSKEPLPRTLDAAVTRLLAQMSDDDKKLVRETKEGDLIRFHLGWGMGIRNEFGLWGGNDELIRSACGGELCHPD